MLLKFMEIDSLLGRILSFFTYNSIENFFMITWGKFYLHMTLNEKLFAQFSFLLLQKQLL